MKVALVTWEDTTNSVVIYHDEDNLNMVLDRIADPALVIKREEIDLSEGFIIDADTAGVIGEGVITL